MSAYQPGPVVLTHCGRTYRVKPSEFGGYSVVQVLSSGIAKPVRDLNERAAVILKATGSTHV
jgi:hypothetical protein